MASTSAVPSKGPSATESPSRRSPAPRRRGRPGAFAALWAPPAPRGPATGPRLELPASLAEVPAKDTGLGGEEAPPRVYPSPRFRHPGPDARDSGDSGEAGDAPFRPGPAILMAPAIAAPSSAMAPAAGSAAHAQAEIAAMAERMVTAFSVGRVGPGGERGHAIRMSLALGAGTGLGQASGVLEVELHLDGDELRVSLAPDARCAAEASALGAALEERLGADVTIR